MDDYVAKNVHTYLRGEGNFHLDVWLLQPSISQCKVS